MATVIHVTHEAVQKVGGIGEVLRGLICSCAYRAAVERSILVGPLPDAESAEPLGPHGEVLYDRRLGIWDDDIGPLLAEVESAEGVRLVYGWRRLDTAAGLSVEVILVDVSNAPTGLTAFKHQLFEHYGIPSDRYDFDGGEYETYVRLAGPAFAAIDALLRDASPRYVIAHEFMGLPTALRAKLSADPRYATIFYAHEVATVRRLIEESEGHDVMFYNVLRCARDAGVLLEDVFGPQDDYYKHALVRRAWHCDAVFAVGDFVEQELAFLGPEFSSRPATLVYNGVASQQLALSDKRAARLKLAAYAEQLLHFRPDHVFSHVSRLVGSKGLWRDLLVCESLDKILLKRGRSGVLIVLATAAGRRPGASVERMVEDYGWPLVHREGLPDLAESERLFDESVRLFNTRSRALKVVFVNQFGWDPDSCGDGMPPDMTFDDLRQGSDVEFGQSIYEPFGIAQIEPIGYGGTSVISDVCGCLGFLRAAGAGDGEPATGYVRADYTRLQEPLDLLAARDIGAEHLRAAEHQRSREAAHQLARLLPTTDEDLKRQLSTGYEIAARMSWEKVAEGYFLPALRGIPM